jgi:hypothetical protein
MLIGIAGVTWCTLEASGVAILETRKPDSGTRMPRVWYVTHERDLARGRNAAEPLVA